MSTKNDSIRVVSGDSDTQIELPLESDQTLVLKTLTKNFPGACGLKYKSASNSGVYRGLRLLDDRFYPPMDGGWQAHIFTVAFPKDMKSGILENGLRSLSFTHSSSTGKRVSDRKRCSDMIVLGMAWKTTEESMTEYFLKFGDLAMVQLKRNPTTKQSKGYGFIRYHDYGAQVTCLSEKHFIDGRWCEVKIPNSKYEADRQEVTRKIYVGGLSEGVTADSIREFFTVYGAVSDVFIPRPFRSFAFVTFLDQDVAQNLLGKQLSFGDSTINIGSAAPKLPIEMRHNYNNSNNSNYFVAHHPHNSQFMNHFGSLHGSLSTPNATPKHYPHHFGNQPNNSMEQNSTLLAAINILNNPAVFNTIMNLAASATCRPHPGGASAPNPAGVSATSAQASLGPNPTSFVAGAAATSGTTGGAPPGCYPLQGGVLPLQHPTATHHLHHSTPKQAHFIGPSAASVMGAASTNSVAHPVAPAGGVGASKASASSTAPTMPHVVGPVQAVLPGIPLLAHQQSISRNHGNFK